MPPEQNPQHPRRPHHYRGRRNQDRRGGDRRPPSQPAEPVNRDNLDVEQIMREIRARIAERHQVTLSAPQIQELAARRLEAILDPATVNPSLMDALRRAAGTPVDPPPPTTPAEAVFDEAALYQSPNAFVRFMRTLLNPLLRLFFDPAVLAQAFRAQETRQRAAETREAERRQTQAEWNALHFEILRRLVNDIARNDLDAQQLALRVEALAGRVDFNERRVRGLEPPPPSARPQPRAPEPAAQTAAPGAAVDGTDPAEPGSDAADPARRKRRRRRGRRSGGQVRDAFGTLIPTAATAGLPDAADDDEPADDDTLDPGAPATVAASGDVDAPPEREPEPDLPLPVVESDAPDTPAGDPEAARRTAPAEPPAAPDPSDH